MTQIIVFEYSKEVNEWLAGEGLFHTIKDIKLVDTGRQRIFMVIYEKDL